MNILVQVPEPAFLEPGIWSDDLYTPGVTDDLGGAGVNDGTLATDKSSR